MTDTVGVIGAGRMGAAMTARLRSAGVEVVLWNRTAARAAAVAAATGARVAATARGAAAAGPVVLVSLADDAACRAAYDGPDGIVAGAGPGTVVADTSTVAPGTSIELAALVAAGGGAMLDTPVSGSVPVVERGELTVMAGGRVAVLDRARPVLDLLARQIFHVGEHGAGATMKLAVNALVHALNQAVSEALVLAERSGVARRAAYEVFANSVAGGPFVQYKRAAFERPGQTPVAFSLDLVGKDLDLILDLAARSGASMPQAAANRRAVADAVAAGLGDEDMSVLARYLRGLA
ncbi:NAD(P)-dependent oxidoreductase [Jiangella alkaliphila]|uniref:2-hydroxy-3-oxopropionate reductase n=1 Tax=Jiangella alkaliphila TaxID=419479 RepID=A0A1H2LHG4_9ACTN|nr:NAD(P)-dependent oxidoreductase [Jiangella alkaliphila]SDU80503.1 2-hydroxy-3-oxopropionate reductase [Jiangella alkaliphila]